MFASNRMRVGEHSSKGTQPFKRECDGTAHWGAAPASKGWQAGAEPYGITY